MSTNKKIGIIFALNEELEETKKIFDNVKIHSLYNLKIYECKNEKVDCFLVESGIGKVNAARTAQILIDKMNVDYVLNVGVAGSISREIKKCDIVIADKLVQHDFDFTLFNYEKGEIPNVGRYINGDKELVKLARKINIETNLTVGTISSGDIFISDQKMGEKINKKFNALCVEMEGAAIAQVCYLSQIPFLVVRAISDSPYDKDNHITFEEFLKISSSMAAKFVEQLIKKI